MTCSIPPQRCQQYWNLDTKDSVYSTHFDIWNIFFLFKVGTSAKVRCTGTNLQSMEYLTGTVSNFPACNSSYKCAPPWLKAIAPDPRAPKVDFKWPRSSDSGLHQKHLHVQADNLMRSRVISADWQRVTMNDFQRCSQPLPLTRVPVVLFSVNQFPSTSCKKHRRSNNVF